jgi:hypothetical protein
VSALYYFRLLGLTQCCFLFVWVFPWLLLQQLTAIVKLLEQLIFRICLKNNNDFLDLALNLSFVCSFIFHQVEVHFCNFALYLYCESKEFSAGGLTLTSGISSGIFRGNLGILTFQLEFSIDFFCVCGKVTFHISRHSGSYNDSMYLVHIVILSYWHLVDAMPC